MNRVHLPQYGVTWEYQGRNAIRSEWKMEHTARARSLRRSGVRVAALTGTAQALHRDALIEGGPPLWAALLLFLGAPAGNRGGDDASLQPSTRPALRPGQSTAGSPGGCSVRVLRGYAAVRTGFGASRSSATSASITRSTPSQPSPSVPGSWREARSCSLARSSSRISRSAPGRGAVHPVRTSSPTTGAGRTSPSGSGSATASTASSVGEGSCS